MAGVCETRPKSVWVTDNKTLKFRAYPTQYDVDSLRTAITAVIGPKYPTLIAPDIIIVKFEAGISSNRALPADEQLEANVEYVFQIPETVLSPASVTKSVAKCRQSDAMLFRLTYFEEFDAAATSKRSRRLAAILLYQTCSAVLTHPERESFVKSFGFENDEGLWRPVTVLFFGDDRWVERYKAAWEWYEGWRTNRSKSNEPFEPLDSTETELGESSRAAHLTDIRLRGLETELLTPTDFTNETNVTLRSLACVALYEGLKSHLSDSDFVGALGYSRLDAQRNLAFFLAGYSDYWEWRYAQGHSLWKRLRSALRLRGHPAE